MFDRESSCVLEQLLLLLTDNNSISGKWFLKQELKTVLCILIIVLNAE